MFNHSKQNHTIFGAAPPRHRRRGQALLLAVLLMVFVAVLGSAFISVVALNLNQTARHDDLALARSAAQAGVDFVNEQLVGSAPGDRWRPEMAALPPAPGSPDYNFYYTPFDRAQGWARTTPAWNAADVVPNWSIAGDWDRDGTLDPLKDDWAKLEYDKKTNRAPVFVKFPDPRSPISTRGALTFLAEVRRLDATDKRGLLQISIIGQAENNPAVFKRRIAFKGGPGQNPLTAVARAVTNWDFLNRTVPSAQVEADVAVATSSLLLKNIQGRFPAAGGFYVVIGDSSTNVVRGAVVTGFDAATRILSLAAPLTARAGERVEMAAGLGAPARLDFNADGARTPATEEVDFAISSAATPGGVWVNGGLLWFGNALSNNLRSSQLDGATTPAASIRASGLMCYDSLATDPADPTTVKLQNATYQSQSAAQSTLSSGTLASSSAAPEFPGAWMSSSGQALSAAEKAQLVDDGWNRLANNNAAAERQTRPFAPPDITAGGSFGRYRQLSQYSSPLSAASPGAAFFGYGEGIYIDNPGDKERIFDPATSRLRDMTPTELRQLWLSGANTSTHFRLGTPAAATNANASLEEQHLRGWIGADEFRARGVLVELIDTDVNGAALAEPRLVITRDARADGTTADANGVVPNQGPVADKGWRDENGARRGESTLGGVYRQEFAWPKNGVIFAEGNVRVRGSGSGAPRSLTIVSMNNIYIEGSLNAGRRKVLLLARRNVILNPTGALARIEAQTRVRDASDPNSTRVYDAASFRIGEQVAVTDDGITTFHEVAVVTPDATDPRLQFNPPLSVAANALIRSRADTFTSPAFSALQNFDDVVQRRFTSSAAGVRVALRHGAARVTAFTLGADESSPPSDPNPLLGIKVVPTPAVPTPGPPSALVRPTNKTLDVSYTGGAPGTDTFPLMQPTSQSDAVAYSIAQLRQVILYTRPASGGPTYPWSYTSPTPPGYQNLPFFFLAGIGNRFDGMGAVAPNNERRPNLINSDYNIPLATSVTLALDGVNRMLRGDRWNETLGSGGAFESVPQFGFNPIHGAPADDATLWEDALTVDQSFYSSNPNRFTLDSRVLEGIGAGEHSMVMQFNRGSGLAGDAPLASYFSGSETPPYNTLPAYRVSRLKLENTDQLNADQQWETLSPGRTLDVNAFVYAQEGSWIVLSGGDFDAGIKGVAGVRGTYLDINNNDAIDAGEYLDADGSGTFSDGDFADLDRDGIISRAEQAAIYRYRRYNTKINFTGAITENQSTLVRDPDGSGPLIGGVASWMDAWSTANINSANWSDSGASFLDTLSFANGGFGNISYTFDDSALKGFFDLNGNNTSDPGEELAADAGFNVPISTELIYQ